MGKLSAFIMCAMLATSGIGYAQQTSTTPEGFKYQASLRNAQGEVIADKLVSIRISILSKGNNLKGGNNETVYSEVHTVSTNKLGMVSFEIGNGTAVTGDFSAISWGSTEHFIQIEMDETGGDSYKILGTSQLVSVPYALHAKMASDVMPGSITIQNEIAARKEADDMLQSQVNIIRGILESSAGGNNDLLGRSGSTNQGLAQDLDTLEMRYMADSAAKNTRINNNLTRFTNDSAAKNTRINNNLTRFMDDSVAVRGLITTLQNNLQTQITNNLTRFKNDSTALRTMIAAETARAIAVEASLSTNVTSEAARAAGAEAMLDARITAETNRAGEIEAGLRSDLTAETNRSTSVDTAQATTNAAQATTNANLQNAITSEAATARATEQANATAIANEAIRATAAETTLDGKVTTEKNRAEATEAGLASDIATASSTAAAATATVQANLDAEITRATNAEQANATAITAEATTARAAETTLETAITDEATRATAAEQANTIAISDEAATARTAESGLDTRVTTLEATDAAQALINADQATTNTNLQTAIDTEAATARAAEQANAAAITDEAATARAAEAALAAAAAQTTDGLQAQITAEVNRSTGVDAAQALTNLAQTQNNAAQAADIAANATAITAEAETARTAETALGAQITSEASRAEGVEGGLNTRVTALEATDAAQAIINADQATTNANQAANNTLQASSIAANATAITNETNRATAAEATKWGNTGNAGTNPNSNFIGTTDNQDLVAKTNNQERLRIKSSGQVEINTTTGSLLMPRLTTAQRDALTGTPGMTIYNTTVNKFQGYSGTGNGAEALDQNSSTTQYNGLTLGYYGQSFTAGSTGNLSKLVLNISQMYTAGSYTLKIKSGTATGTTPFYTQTVTVNSTGEQTFTITGAAPLTTGNVYTFWFEPIGSSNALVYYSYPSTYSGGGVFYSPGNYNYDYTMYYDINFKTYITPPGSWQDLPGASVADLTSTTSGLQSQITAEVARATNVENGLRTDVNTATNTNNSQANSITNLQSQVNAEISRATSAENTERNRATGAESGLDTRIDSLEATGTDQTNTNSGLQAAIAAEVATARAAEAGLANDIAVAAATAANSSAAVQSNLNAEVARATAAEQTNAAAITAEATTARAAESGLNTRVTALEAADATQATTNTGIQTQVTNNLTRFKNDSTAVRGLITNETNRATAAEATKWGNTGNAGTNAATNFIGTTDNVDVVAKTNNVERLRIKSSGQVEINTTTGSLLMPRLTTAQRDGLTPAAGMTIYNATTNKFQGYVGSSDALDQSCNTTQYGFSLTYWGQSFTAGTTGTLSKVGYNVSYVPSPGNFTLKIKNGTTGTTTPFYTQTITINSAGEQTFPITGAVNLTSGNVYSIWLESVGGSDVNGYGSDTNPYSGGELFYSTTHSYGYTNYDLNFKTYITSGTSSSGWQDMPGASVASLTASEAGLQTQLTNNLTRFKNDSTAVRGLITTETNRALGIEGGLRTDVNAANSLANTANNTANSANATANNAWARSGNSASASDFIGTTNAQDVVIKRNNVVSERIYTGGATVWSGDVSAGVTPVSGAGTRMMWVPEKRAFRAGQVTGTQWDNASIGYNSTATGANSIASGNNSTAMGIDNIAGGEFSIAMGKTSIANGQGAVSIGYNNTASGEASTAFGRYTNSSGYNSTTMGMNTAASGSVSTAMGYLTTASGDASTAMGSYVSTNGQQGSFIIGDNSATTARISTTPNQYSAFFTNGFKLMGGPVTAQNLSGTGIRMVTADANGTLSTQAVPSFSGWGSTGNSAASTDFIGTTNAQDLVTKTNNTERMRVTSAGEVQIAGQVKINTTTGGFVLPRLTTAQRNALTPEAGMQVYNTSTYKFQGYVVVPGTQAIDQSQTAWPYQNSFYNAGQTFIAGVTGLLSKIEINIYSFSAAGACTLRVYSGSGVNEANLLTTVTGTITSNGVKSFDLSGVNVVSGQTYSFRVENSAACYILVSTGNSYTSGSWIDNGGNVDTTYDLKFATYVTPVSASWVDLH